MIVPNEDVTIGRKRYQVNQFWFCTSRRTNSRIVPKNYNGIAKSQTHLSLCNLLQEKDVFVEDFFSSIFFPQNLLWFTLRRSRNQGWTWKTEKMHWSALTTPLCCSTTENLEAIFDIFPEMKRIFSLRMRWNRRFLETQHWASVCQSPTDQNKLQNRQFWGQFQ